MPLLATYGSERARKWPEVPTLNEVAPCLVFDSPHGLAAPAGTPAERIRVLHDAFRRGMQEAEFLRVMANFDQTPRYMNTADYTADNIKTFADERVLMHKLGLARE